MNCSSPRSPRCWYVHIHVCTIMYNVCLPCTDTTRFDCTHSVALLFTNCASLPILQACCIAIEAIRQITQECVKHFCKCTGVCAITVKKSPRSISVESHSWLSAVVAHHYFCTVSFHVHTILCTVYVKVASSHTHTHTHALRAICTSDRKWSRCENRCKLLDLYVHVCWGVGTDTEQQWFNHWCSTEMEQKFFVTATVIMGMLV